MILNACIACALYGVVFAVAEIAYRRGLPARFSRKIAHIGAGIISFTLPFFLDLAGTLVLGAVFAVLLIWTSRHHLLNGIHGLEGESLGAVFFPIGLAAGAAMFWRIDPFLFQVAALLLGFSDGLAGMAGNVYGKKSYNVTGPKTYIGSVTFFAVTFIIMLLSALYIGSFDSPTLINIVFSSLALTVVEGLLGKGWDNLILPPASCCLLYFIFCSR
jgi:dolichol kinase